MRTLRFTSAALGLLLLAGLPAGRAQYPMGPAVAPPPPTPLLYLRLNEPKGMKVTLYTGQTRPVTLETPCTLAFRPGYSYRLALSDVPGFPQQVFFPTLEVRGSLLLGPKLRAADFPVALNFGADDFGRVQAGAVVKKVVVVERPDAAIPQATTPTTPLEVSVPPARDPWAEARDRGMPLAVLHLGQRTFSPDELMGQAVAGTVLLPGERFLPSPRVAPWVGWHWCPVYDPVHGPVHPGEFMTLCDGGDSRYPAGFTPEGKVAGVDPSDTVAEYTNSKGVRKLAASNRVCLCIPRFVILRGETMPGDLLARLTPDAATVARGQGTITGARGLEGHVYLVQPEAVGQRVRPSGTSNVYGTAITGTVRGTAIVTTLRAVENVTGLCVRPETEAPDLPLLIIKWPDKCGALVGEVVTFHLKYTNQGGQPISNVVVTDSLTGRFEYVPNTSKTDRQALFTTMPNEAGSQTLRWEFPGTLFPRESGVISFQVRVR